MNFLKHHEVLKAYIKQDSKLNCSIVMIYLLSECNKKHTSTMTKNFLAHCPSFEEDKGSHLKMLSTLTMILKNMTKSQTNVKVSRLAYDHEFKKPKQFTKKQTRPHNLEGLSFEPTFDNIKSLILTLNANSTDLFLDLI